MKLKQLILKHTNLYVIQHLLDICKYENSDKMLDEPEQQLSIKKLTIPILMKREYMHTDIFYFLSHANINSK